MFIPVIISAFISSVIINIIPVNGLDSIHSHFSLSAEKRVLGATDVIVDKAHNFFYLRHNYLPHNEDKINFPEKIIKDNDFFATAKSGVVIDKDTGISLWRKSINEKRSIASITKLMTAMVFLENNPGWDKIYTITKKDRVDGGRIYLYSGDEVTIRNLFSLSLVGSANTATMALAHSTGMSKEEFVEKMNEKARELNLSNTSFIDPVGISKENISTAREVAHMARRAFSIEDIKSTTRTKKYQFKTLGERIVKVDSTDKLLLYFPVNNIDIVSGKTGYTNNAGSCFVGEFTRDGKEVISVILGARNNEDRFLETKDLISWIFTNYKWLNN